MRDFIAEYIKKLPKSGIRDFFGIVQSIPGVISLGIGEPDFATPQHIRAAVVSCLNKGHINYTVNLGLMELREEISRYVEENYHIYYDPKSEIIVTVGVSEALDLAIRATLNPGDELLYHEPCYVSYNPSIALAHAVPRMVHCSEKDKFSVTPEALETAVTDKTRALLLNFPTNPTGGTMTRQELQEVANFAQKRDLLVLTDEIYSELTYEGGHTSIAALPGMKERTIFLHGFSKAFAMTGFRIGYACGPAPIIAAMDSIHQYTIICTNTAAQYAAIEALRHGQSDVEAMRLEYKKRRDFIVGALNSMGLTCHTPHGSFYAFPSIAKTGLTSKEFCKRLVEEQKVACVPGDAFGPSGEGFMRCCFATSLDQIEIAMERIQKFLKTC